MSDRAPKIWERRWWQERVWWPLRYRFGLCWLGGHEYRHCFSEYGDSYACEWCGRKEADGDD